MNDLHTISPEEIGNGETIHDGGQANSKKQVCI